MWGQLDDLDFVVNIALLAHTRIQMQEKTEGATKLGLTPNTAKTEAMKIHSKTSIPILMHSTALGEVEAFTYPGSVVDTTRGTDADI